MDIVIGILAIGCRVIEDGKANLATHAGAADFLGNYLVKKIHISKAGGARRDHFGHGYFGTITDEFFADMGCFRGPDMIF